MTCRTCRLPLVNAVLATLAAARLAAPANTSGLVELSGENLDFCYFVIGIVYIYIMILSYNIYIYIFIYIQIKCLTGMLAHCNYPECGFIIHKTFGWENLDEPWINCKIMHWFLFHKKMWLWYSRVSQGDLLLGHVHSGIPRDWTSMLLVVPHR